MNKLNKKVRIIILITIILIISLISIIYFTVSNNDYETLDSLRIVETNEKKEENLQVDSADIETNEIHNKQEAEKIAIHIIGEVKKKGIIYLPQGSRIIDAIEKAGGATKNANLDNVNLAYILADGQKIYIPNKKEKNISQEYITTNSGENVVVEGEKDTSENASNSNTISGKVNINTAKQTELETLPGIGASLAQRIMEYREKNGKFKKKEEIKNVKGIGDAKYSNIEEYICI